MTVPQHPPGRPHHDPRGRTRHSPELVIAGGTPKLTFIGHTDSRGDAASNQQLSVDRGTAIANWFEAWSDANDTDGWTIEVEGRGDTDLAVADVDADGVFLEAAGALNRRVGITIEAEGCAP